jgi:hypothetical protein
VDFLPAIESGTGLLVNRRFPSDISHKIGLDGVVRTVPGRVRMPQSRPAGVSFCLILGYRLFTVWKPCRNSDILSGRSCGGNQVVFESGHEVKDGLVF